jgi:hypothetical protein
VRIWFNFVGEMEQMYRRILGPVYDNEKENWRISTNKEVYVIVKTYRNRDNKTT